MRKRGLPFSKGDVHQGRTVLEVKPSFECLNKYRYRVRYYVCGHEVEVFHKNFLKKIARFGHCEKCTRKRNGVKHGWGTPTSKKAIARRKKEREAKYPKGSEAWCHKLLNEGLRKSGRPGDNE